MFLDFKTYCIKNITRKMNIRSIKTGTESDELILMYTFIYLDPCLSNNLCYGFICKLVALITMVFVKLKVRHVKI